MNVRTIGIDARSMAGQPTGVGRYVLNLVRAMAPMDRSLRLRLYLPQPLEGPEEPWRRLVETVVLPAPGGLGGLDNAFTWNHLRLPLHLARNPVDLFHGPFYTLPAWCPAPAVVTIHDITFDLHPEWFTRRARLSFSGFAASSARKARHVLTVSEQSRSDIIERYGLRADRVTSILLAPDPVFTATVDAASGARGAAGPAAPGAAARTRIGAGEPFILHVGSITPRRNVERLLEAFARVRAKVDAWLVLAGRVEPPSRPLQPLIDKLGLTDRVKVCGYVGGDELVDLYRGASALVCPSLYEGFGLPVAEAMACGVPTVVSRTSCFPEVAGPAALFVDPEDTESIAGGLLSVLTDAPLRERLIAAGRERARQLSWERTAEKTLAVYEAALGSRAGAAVAS